MKIKVIRFVGAIIFPLLFSACVSQNDTVVLINNVRQRRV